MAELPPPPTDPQAFLDALIDYVRSSDVAFPGRLRGAATADIRRYAAASRAFADENALPPLYAAYLRRMGKDDGGLFKGLRLNVSIDETLETYDDFAKAEPDLINPQLPLVGSYIVGEPIAFDLDTGPDDPEVVVSSAGLRWGWVAQSWAHLTVQAAIHYAEPRRRAESRWYSSSPESAARAVAPAEAVRDEVARRLDRLVSRLGLAPAWPSDAGHRVAVSMTTTLFATLGRKGEIMLRLYSDDAALFPQAGDYAREMLGAWGGAIR